MVDLVQAFAQSMVLIWSRHLLSVLFQFDSFLTQVSKKDKNILWGHIGRVLQDFYTIVRKISVLQENLDLMNFKMS